jgi:cytochrome c oxidase subunit 2
MRRGTGCTADVAPRRSQTVAALAGARLVSAVAAALLGGYAAAAVQQDVGRPGGVQAEHILRLWHGTLALCTVVFVLVAGAVLLALWRAPRASAQSAPDLAPLDQPEPAPRRAVGWAVALSCIGLAGLLWADVRTSSALAQLPADGALRIELTGKQWWWHAAYHDPLNGARFVTANELHLPVGRAAIITLRSDDVIHTLWLPNLHGKKDMLPGRVTEIRLRADQPGEYRGQCAEFCGQQHTLMALLVVAETPQQYQAWAAGQARAAAVPSGTAQRGRQVFAEQRCAGCHTIAGSAAAGVAGPDLTHLASRRTLAAGTLPNTRGHLAGWVVDAPSLKPGTLMPAAPMAPADLHALLAYLETLK